MEARMAIVQILVHGQLDEGAREQTWQSTFSTGSCAIRLESHVLNKPGLISIHIGYTSGAVLEQCSHQSVNGLASRWRFRLFCA